MNRHLSTHLPPRQLHRPGRGLVWTADADRMVAATTAAWTRWAATQPQQLALPVVTR